MPRKSQEPKRPPLPEIDLRPICRDSSACAVLVSLVEPFDTGRQQWLHLGRSSLEHHGHERHYGRWFLMARMGADGANRGVPTDPEHDSAYACKLPLIGVSVTSIREHQTTARGFIDPTLDVNDPHNGFCVPSSSDYDPRKHPDAAECDEKSCLESSVEDGGGPHIIVPEGFYVPKFDRALYEAVRGREVEVFFYMPRSV